VPQIAAAIILIKEAYHWQKEESFVKKGAQNIKHLINFKGTSDQKRAFAFSKSYTAKVPLYSAANRCKVCVSNKEEEFTAPVLDLILIARIIFTEIE